MQVADDAVKTLHWLLLRYDELGKQTSVVSDKDECRVAEPLEDLQTTWQSNSASSRDKSSWAT